MDNYILLLAQNFFIPFFLVLTALTAVLLKDLLSSAIMLSIFSLLMAVQYLLLQAPDVAMTEAAVGAGISTILLLMTIYIVGQSEKKFRVRLLLPLLILSSVFIGLLAITFDMPEFGSNSSPAQSYLAKYYIENAILQTGVPNAVTAILASYRGFDTLGETTVIFTAAIAIYLLLKKDK